MADHMAIEAQVDTVATDPQLDIGVVQGEMAAAPLAFWDHMAASRVAVECLHSA